MSDLEFQRVDYGHFKALAVPIQRAQQQAHIRHDQYRKIAFLSTLLHVGGAIMLRRGIDTLNATQIVRSAYVHIGASLLQAVGHTRLRWSKMAVEEGTKELKKELKARAKDSKELVAPLARQLFENFQQWGAHSLKYAEGEKIACDLPAFAVQCERVCKERRALKWEARVSLGAIGGFAAMLMLTLYLKRSVGAVLPVAIGGIAVSLANGALCSGTREWKRLEEARLQEAIRRVITLANGDDLDDAVARSVRKLKLADKSDDKLAVMVKKCTRLKELSVTGAALTGASVKDLPPSTKSIEFLGASALSIPFDQISARVKRMALTRFPAGEASRLWGLTRLRVEKCSQPEMDAIALLPALTDLRIDTFTVGRVSLPRKLEKLKLPHLWGTDIISGCHDLKKVTLNQFWVNTGGALATLPALEILKVKSGVCLGKGDLDWMVHHSDLQEVSIKELWKGGLSLDKLQMLHKNFLVYASGTKDDLSLDQVGKALERVKKVTFKVRH